MSKFYCCGYNYYGQCANGNTKTVASLKPMSKIDKTITMKSMTIGAYGSTYIITDNDNLFVFGCNDCRQLGLSEKFIVGIVIPTWYKVHVIHIDVVNLISDYIKGILPWNSVPSPVFIQDFQVSYISKGIAAKHQFIITKHSQQLYGAGYNDVHSISPAESINIEQNICSEWTKINFFVNEKIRLKQIACAQYYTTFLSDNGDVFSVGRSFYGGLGFGHDIDNLKNVKQILFSAKDVKFKDIASGCDHTLGLTETGTVWSWGRNQFGQLGIGGTVFTTIPQRIKLSFDIIIEKLSCGYNHNILLDTNNTMYCFGINQANQCGSISAKDLFLPNCDAYDSLKDVTIIDIECGAYHNVIKSDKDEYYLWGLNNYRQCLVSDAFLSSVKSPTKFEAKHYFKDDEVVIAMIPGYMETRVITKMI